MIDKEIKVTYIISGANNRKSKELKNRLESDYTLGEDNYPKDPEAALGQLNHFCPTNLASRRAGRPDSCKADRKRDEDRLQYLQDRRKNPEED